MEILKSISSVAYAAKNYNTIRYMGLEVFF